MKTKLFLKTALVFLFCCILIYSCKKSDVDNNVDTNQSINKTPLLGTDPVGPDRALPYSYPDWMANLDGSKYLSEITIPGTHDCAADLHTSEQGAESDITIAQDFFIANQLLLGVRWFDLRLHDDDGIMTMFHGPYYLHKNFTDMVLPTLQFLDNYPSEVVVFMIKQENSSRGDDAFANGVMGYLNWAHPGRFWMNSYVPQLSEVRGKVVIVRQFTGTHGYALGTRIMWSDNTSGTYASTDLPVYAYVQDHYKTNTVTWQTKACEVEACIEKAHNEPCPQRCYYLNFSSCESDVAGYSLKWLASNINPTINNYLLSNPTWHNCGVIFVNFAGGSDDGTVPIDLVRTIIKQNSFVDSVAIGLQIWANKNLSVTHYRDGTPIPNITDPTAWANDTIGAYCHYNNGSNDYGILYNWYAVNNIHGLAPAGWHVATNSDWSELASFLGQTNVGGILKDVGTDHWWSPNTGATNQYGFTAYPGGVREPNGSFSLVGQQANWWCYTVSWPPDDFNVLINYNSGDIDFQISNNRHYGFSVRCVKN